MYWAEALANQDKDPALKVEFADIYNQLSTKEATILNELIDCQGTSVDIDGYYLPNEHLTSNAMRPSETLNSILN